MGLSRRSFLTGTAALAAAAATTAASPMPSGRLLRLGGRLLPRVPLTREEHRVVIVGSGFGGGVSALRLAEAGVDDILVLERGRWWPTGPNARTFPDVPDLDERALWHGTIGNVMPGILPPIQTPATYAGLLDAHVGLNMTVLTAAGVGGGSLVYQGMTLQPSRAVMEEVFPAGLDHHRLDRVHYPRVARMLQVTTAPDELIEHPNYLAPRIFRRNALEAGYGVERIPMPIDWDFALAELRGEMRPSYTNGNGFLGVNNGGKHSIDVTYIARAQATGRATVASLHDVTGIARTSAGRWRVHVDRRSVRGDLLEQKVITTPTLILAAGSVNTTKLLLRARHHGLIPNLSDEVGAGWGSNGDRIVVWSNLQDDVGAEQGGPVVFGSKEWEDPTRANTVIQASIPPLGFNHRSTIMVGFGVSEARGRWIYDPLLDDIQLVWEREADRVLHRRIWQRMTDIAGPGGILTDLQTPVPNTWHPLGGACMETVCDLEGRVHDSPGLYVLDGALIPGTTGACNPSMTIAAIAERALDHLVREDVGVRI